MVSEEMSVLLKRFCQAELTEKELYKELLPACFHCSEEIRPDIFPNPAAPPWTWREFYVWALGEELRQLLLQKKLSPKSNLLYEFVDTIIRDKRFGHGRQSFFMLLPKLKRYDFEFLKASLSDHDVVGHVVYALRRLKEYRLAPIVAEMVKSPDYVWNRKEARRYIERATQATEQAGA